MPGRPVFGMRLEGSVGFLANRYDILGLHERLEAACKIKLRSLKAEIEQVSGHKRTVFSFNEIVLMRQRLQAAKLMITTGGTEQARELVGDGVLVATPVGSTGYNRSQGGPRLPLDSSLLAVTGLAVHYTSDWANAVLSDRELIDVEARDPEYRPVRLESFLGGKIEGRPTGMPTGLISPWRMLLRACRRPAIA
jgi:NAD+ kinase